MGRTRLPGRARLRPQGPRATAPQIVAPGTSAPTGNGNSRVRTMCVPARRSHEYRSSANAVRVVDPTVARALLERPDLAQQPSGNRPAPDDVGTGGRRHGRHCVFGAVVEDAHAPLSGVVLCEQGGKRPPQAACLVPGRHHDSHRGPDRRLRRRRLLFGARPRRPRAGGMSDDRKPDEQRERDGGEHDLHRIESVRSRRWTSS